MIARTSSKLMVITALASFAACHDGATAPSAPQSASTEATLDVSTHAAADARGGANWTLHVFGLEVDNVLAFNATRYVDGSVTGQIEYQQTVLGETTRYHGTVTCISVYDGNRAKFGGPITRSDDPLIPVGVYMWFTVVDNGQGASGTPDRSSIFGIGDNQANEEFCASSALPNPLFSTDVTSGNIKVEG